MFLLYLLVFKSVYVIDISLSQALFLYLVLHCPDRSPFFKETLYNLTGDLKQSTTIGV